MRVSLEQISAVIGGIYAAVDHPEGFTPVVRQVRHLVNGSSGVLLTPEVDPVRQGFGYVDHFDVELFNRYPTTFLDRDVWLNSARSKNLLRSGKVLVNEMVVSDEDFRRLPIYHEVFVPNDGVRVCSGVIAGYDDPVFPLAYLSIFRGVNSRPFGVSEQRIIQLLTPHFAQALRLAKNLRVLQARVGDSQQALQELACGLLLLDRQWRVLFMNRAAEQLCRRERGLVVTAGRHAGECVPLAVLSGLQSGLQRAIEAALRTSERACTDDLSTAPAQPLVIRGSGGASPLLVTAVPLPAREGGFGIEAARVVLLVEDSAAHREPGDRLLVGLFGLTPAECRVARALVAGRRPKVIASDLDVSEHTVRTQIKSLYAKTGTRGLSPLIGLLSRLAESRAAAS